MLLLNIGLKARPLDTFAEELFSQVSFHSSVEGWIVNVMFFSCPEGFSLLLFGFNLSLYAYIRSCLVLPGTSACAAFFFVRRDIRKFLDYILWDSTETCCWDSFDDVRGWLLFAWT